MNGQGRLLGRRLLGRLGRRLLGLGVLLGVLGAPAIEGQAGAPFKGCPAGSADYACGDRFFGGCPPSECRLLLRRIAYASENRIEALEREYAERCVRDSSCDLQLGDLRSLYTQWNEIYQRVSQECSPQIDPEILSGLPKIEEKCRASEAARLHQSLRELRCRILQARGVECPQREQIACPVPLEMVKPLLNPLRQLCDYPGLDPMPIYYCTGGSKSIELGALCPGEPAAARERPDCHLWLQFEGGRWAEDLGVEAFRPLALLPGARPGGRGWLDRIGGPTHVDGFRLGSAAAWSVDPEWHPSTTGPLVILARDENQAVYVGTTSSNTPVRWVRAEGWTPQQLDDSGVCSRSRSERHGADWRALQRELLRVSHRLRPLIQGAEVVEEPHRISVRCFADDETEICFRMLSAKIGGLYLRPEINVEAWEPLKHRWFTPDADPGDDLLRPFLQALADQARPFYLLAVDPQGGAALAHQDGGLWVLALEVEGVAAHATSWGLERLLRRWLAPGDAADPSAARALVAQQLGLPGGLLLNDPGNTQGRSCWVLGDGATRCLEAAGTEGALVDPRNYWGSNLRLLAATEVLRGLLVDGGDLTQSHLGTALQAVGREKSLATVLDFPRLDEDWLAWLEGPSSRQPGICELELRFRGPDSDGSVQAKIFEAGDSDLEPHCDTWWPAYYARFGLALLAQRDLDAHRDSLRLLIQGPHEDWADVDSSAWVYRDRDGDHLVFFNHDPQRAVGPFRWNCLAAEASDSGYGQFSRDSAGLEDFTRCVLDAEHPCRERRTKAPALWLSDKSETNRCRSTRARS